MERIKQMNLEKPNATVFEIGCHHMEDTGHTRSLWPGAAIFCFEPDPRNIKYIEENKMTSKLNCKLFKFALSDYDGISNFYMSSGIPPGIDGVKDWDFSSSISKPKLHLVDHPWCTFDTQCNVEVRRLDNVCKVEHIDYIDFIWMDVQGVEGQVLSGAGDMLKNIHYIYTEYSNHEQYEGQKDLDSLHKMLVGWSIVEVYINDVLFSNDLYSK